MNWKRFQLCNDRHNLHHTNCPSKPILKGKTSTEPKINNNSNSKWEYCECAHIVAVDVCYFTHKNTAQNTLHYNNNNISDKENNNNNHELNALFLYPLLLTIAIVYVYVSSHTTFSVAVFRLPRLPLPVALCIPCPGFVKILALFIHSPCVLPLSSSLSLYIFVFYHRFLLPFISCHCTLSHIINFNHYYRMLIRLPLCGAVLCRYVVNSALYMRAYTHTSRSQ